MAHGSLQSRAIDQPLVLLQIRLRRSHRIAGRMLHSITLSARRITASGIDIPRDLAVLRFSTNSNLVGCSTGKSAGLATLRILSTYCAALANMASAFAP